MYHSPKENHGEETYPKQSGLCRNDSGEGVCSALSSLFISSPNLITISQDSPKVWKPQPP